MPILFKQLDRSWCGMVVLADIVKCLPNEPCMGCPTARLPRLANSTFILKALSSALSTSFNSLSKDQLFSLYFDFNFGC